jgi:Zn-dependent protease
VVFTTDWLRDIGLDYAPKHYAFDGFSGNIHLQWKLHQESKEKIRSSLGVSFVQLSPQQHAETEARLSQENAAFIKKKYTRTLADGTDVFTRHHAWNITHMMIKANDRRKKAKNVRVLPPVSIEASIQTDTNLFEPMLKDKKVTQTFNKKVWIFAATIILSAIAFGIMFSWKQSPIILLVLLIHELGHWSGMKIFKYKDTSIFFVPFFGALTVGKNEDATPMQKLTVFLLGPVPGIFIGMAALWISHAFFKPDLQVIGWMFLILNYINLLPITPLDGGHIVDLLVSNRYPRIRMFLIGFSALALIAATLFLHEKFTGIIGVLFLLTLPNNWRIQKNIKALQSELKQLQDKKDLLATIVSFTYRNPEAKKYSGGRFGLVKQLYSFACSPLPTRSEAFKGIGLYIICLALPFIGIVTTPLFMHYSMPEPPNWKNKIGQAHSSVERRDILIDAAEWYYYEEEYPEQASLYYHQALTLSDSMHLKDARTVKILREIAYLEADTLMMKIYLTKALDYAEHFNSSNQKEVAEVLEQFASPEKNIISDDEKILYLQRAICIRDSLRQVSEKSITQQALAGLYYRHGKSAPAESLLVISIQSLDTVENANYFIENGVHFLAELYEHSGRSPLAISLLNHAEVRLGDTLKGGMVLNALEIASHRGWIALRQKDTMLTYETFRKTANRAKPINNAKGLSFFAAKYILDLCYLELVRGHREQALEQFTWLKEKTNSDILRRIYGSADIIDTTQYESPYNVWRNQRSKAHAYVLTQLLSSE